MAAVRGIIVAMSPEGVIGLGGRIPWHYPADLKRFKRITTGATVIMGRRTWESIGSRPLPDRRNIVITRRDLPGVECFRDIPSALARCSGAVWFAGGAGIYAEAMSHCDLIDVTQVPDHVEDPDAVRFPPIDPEQWAVSERSVNEADPRLRHTRYRRREVADPR
ncbi:MAG: dihydrofolate reductase [Myxococcota bacterium]